MRRFETYFQLDAMDCGPTCLRMIFRYYGRSIGHEGVRKATQIGPAGVSMLGLSEAAERYGFRTRSARLTYEQLISEVPLPCILHWNSKHFVVLAPSRKNGSLLIADPAKGLISISKQEFRRNWIQSLKSDGQKGIALLLTPRASFYLNENEGTSLDWSIVARYVLRYRPQLVQLILGLFLGSVLNFCFPYLTQSVVDTGIQNHNLQFIQIVLLAQLTLFTAQTFVEFVRSRVLLFVGTRVNFSLVSDFWAKLMRLPLNYFEIKHTADIIQRIGDHKRIENFITGASLNAFFSFLNLFVFALVLLTYSPQVFLVFGASSLVYFSWIRVFLAGRRSLDYERFGIASKVTSSTMQLIGGMIEIKLNNAENIKRWEWERIQASLFKIDFRALSINQVQQLGAGAINQGKNIFITYIVAQSVIDGTLTLGTMLAIQYIVGQMNSPVEQLVSLSQRVQEARISLERINDIHKRENEDSTESMPIQVESYGEITVQNLSFRYPGAGNKPVLDAINITFPAGKTTAIVGYSGSGKTTLLKLLQKFYTDYTGEIKVGNTRLEHIHPTEWRSISSCVIQDGFIFGDTIERNISLSDDPDIRRLVSACEVANIMDFVNSLPLGFKTRIGQDGSGVSSGQRQRILIARAIYRRPSIIFFDEATNALDSENEKVIMNNLHKELQGKTVIIVAHRLSTVRRADNIVVLSAGRIAEQGSHERLVAGKGIYYDLVKNQLEIAN